MSCRSLIYLAFNVGAPGANGWGIAMSTDTAFALGVLALVGPRCPERLRVFLLTVVVADDVVALVVIAVAYTDTFVGAAGRRDRALRAAPRRSRAPERPRPLRTLALGVAGWVALLRVGNPAGDHRSRDGPRDGRVRRHARRSRTRRRSWCACSASSRHPSSRARLAGVASAVSPNERRRPCCTRGRATWSSRCSRSPTPASSSTRR